MTSPILDNTLVSASEDTQASDIIVDTIHNRINFINKTYGFTAVFWYSRGEIDNKSSIGLILREEYMVNAGKLNYRIIQTIPTNKGLLDSTTDPGQELESE